MTDIHDELARRQLAEARARANGAIFRRALMLVVIAGFLLALGTQRPGDMPLAIVSAVVLLVAAGLVVWRGDGFRG